jgi:hypothetical protein
MQNTHLEENSEAFQCWRNCVSHAYQVVKGTSYLPLMTYCWREESNWLLDTQKSAMSAIA